MKARDIVLVVDDSPESLSLLTDALEESGATVLVSLEGANALQLVEHITPDIILMDAVMPGMDGFETCRQLKRKKTLAHVPVIFMTGLTETEHVVKGLKAGGVDYVTKPIAPDELIARMHVHLANARFAQSARIALDASGRFLFAVDRAGRLLWSTPQASKLLNTAFGQAEAEPFVLSSEVRDWLQRRNTEKGSTSDDTMTLRLAGSGLVLQISDVGRIGVDEFLLRLSQGDTSSQAELLKDRLALTLRESEVLLWIARGKSNRDIGEILSLSPRTVTKHLEHIYTKLGVENRSSAAAVAFRILDDR